MRPTCLLVAVFACISMPAFAAPLGAVLFSKSGQLCSLDPVSNFEERCVKHKGEYDDPAWRPGGANIVVGAGMHDGEHHLMLLTSEGSALHPLVHSTDFIRPVWSPDGRYIYAIHYEIGPSIGRWGADGKAFEKLPVLGLEGTYKDYQMLSFSPSGLRAVILVDDFKKMLLVNVNSDAFVALKYVPTGFSYVSQAAWRDESHLLYVGKKDTTRGELWELNVDDGSVQKKGVPGLWIRDFLALSPDNSTAVVCAVSDGAEPNRGWSLWKYSLGLSTAAKISNGIEDTSPQWRH